MNKLMIDQIAFDEAERKILCQVRAFGVLIEDPRLDLKVEIARSIISCMRTELFHTDKTTITNKEETK